jgi:isopenicillin N synthase-like dioxygenase
MTRTRHLAEHQRLSPFLKLSSRLIEVSTHHQNLKNEIREQLVNAAECAGFLTLIDHGITIDEIEAQFTVFKNFFDLPLEIKRENSHRIETNNGYEYKLRIASPKYPKSHEILN